MTKCVSLIVCLAVVAGFVRQNGAFAGDNAAQASRIAVQTHLLKLSARAQQYYWRPSSKGGGGRTFTGLSADANGLTKLTLQATNSEGTFSILTAGDGTSVQLMGIGNEEGDDGSPISVYLLIFADSVAVTFLN